VSRRTITCRVCGQEFESEVKPGTRPAYCSDKCRRDASWRQRQELRQSITELRCSRCGEVKPIAEFSGRTHTYCRPCHAAYARVLRANKSPEQKTRARLVETAWRKGITAEQLLSLLESQNGLCAICRSDLHGDSRRWHVDHDHTCCPDTNGRESGRRQRVCGECIRGILCGNCNVGLGMFHDDPVTLRAAITYLDEQSKRVR